MDNIIYIYTISILFLILNYHFFYIFFNNIKKFDCIFILIIYIITFNFFIYFVNHFNEEEIQLIFLALICILIFTLFTFNKILVQLKMKLYFKRILYIMIYIIDIFFENFVNEYMLCAIGLIFYYILIYPYEFKFLIRFEVDYKEYKKKLFRSNLFYYFYNRSNKYVILIYYTLLISIFIFIQFNLFILLLIHFFILWIEFKFQYELYNLKFPFLKKLNKNINFNNFFKKIIKCKNEVDSLLIYISYFYEKDIDNNKKNKCNVLSNEIRYGSAFVYMFNNLDKEEVQSFLSNYSPIELSLLIYREIYLLYKNNNILTEYLLNKIEKDKLPPFSIELLPIQCYLLNILSSLSILVLFFNSEESYISIQTKNHYF